MDNKDMVLAARQAQQETYPVKFEHQLARVDYRVQIYTVNEFKDGVWFQTIKAIPIK